MSVVTEEKSNIISNFVNEKWDTEVIPVLSEYIAIPNLSPLFDEEWNTNGLIDQAAELLINWAKTVEMDCEMQLLKEEGRTPLIFIDIPATNKDDNKTVLMYGHLDKQPPLDDWREGLSPYTPVLEDGKLYGRGGADDGYAIFAALLSVKALQEANLPHSRVVIIIEASEESSSIDLPFYIEKLEDTIGVVDLVICLDSGCGNYEQFWITSSLRGIIVGNLKAHILEEGAHSGKASGIVPGSFRLQRMLLERIEDMNTGEIKLPELYSDISPQVEQEVSACAEELGDLIHQEFSFVEGAKPTTNDLKTLLLNRNLRPQLTVTGAEGLPTLEKGGNVLRSYTTLKLSIRVPPGVDAKIASEKVKSVLETDTPYGAKVNFRIEKAKSGWGAPVLKEWLAKSVSVNAERFFGKKPSFQGEGGSIPFMSMLGEKFPDAQFIVTGLLGPESNAHGPNEMLHINQGKRVNCTVAGILADHCAN